MPEIVTVFNPGLSAMAIRVYDLRGDVRYEAWHDGNLGEPVWMPQAGLLIFAGRDQNTDPYQHVILALRPVAGVRSQDYVLDPNAADVVKPVWSLRAKPDSFFEHVTRTDVGAAWKPDDPRRNFYFAVFLGDEARPPVRNCSWFFDDSGNLLHGPELNDQYKANQLLEAADPDRPPDPNEVHFIPYPATAPPPTRPVAQP